MAGDFKEDGLEVEIIDLQGGSKTMQALVGGSIDVASGAYEHTITIQAKGQNVQAFVAQGLEAHEVPEDTSYTT